MARNPDKDPFGPWLNGLTWDQAFNGQVWALTKDEDFDLAPKTIVAYIHDEFDKRIGRLDVRSDGDHVYVRVVRP